MIVRGREMERWEEMGEGEREEKRKGGRERERKVEPRSSSSPLKCQQQKGLGPAVAT